MVRGRPSGLKAAPHRFRDGPRPALTPEPLRPLGGRNQGPGAACPRPRARHPAPPALDMVNTGKVIYRHCCDDPLNPRVLEPALISAIKEQVVPGWLRLRPGRPRRRTRRR